MCLSWKDTSPTKRQFSLCKTQMAARTVISGFDTLIFHQFWPIQASSACSLKQTKLCLQAQQYWVPAIPLELFVPFDQCSFKCGLQLENEESIVRSCQSRIASSLNISPFNMSFARHRGRQHASTWLVNVRIRKQCTIASNVWTDKSQVSSEIVRSRPTIICYSELIGSAPRSSPRPFFVFGRVMIDLYLFRVNFVMAKISRPLRSVWQSYRLTLTRRTWMILTEPHNNLPDLKRRQFTLRTQCTVDFFIRACLDCCLQINCYR